MYKPLFLTAVAAIGFSIAASSWGLPFAFSTGNPDGRIGTASRPAAATQIEIESADDFVLASQTSIDHATFTGLLPSGASSSSIQQVAVKIYRVFPLDSINPPSGLVPTRVNSPSDVDFDARSTAAVDLTFATTVLNANFTVANSVINGINKIPNQTTGGEGAVTGEEVQFNVTFTTPFTLPAGHYFFIPQVGLTSGNFLWLSAVKPIVPPGTPFAPDLQSWIRNASLDPDWLRIGTDVIGGSTPPTFNGTFSLSGTAADPPQLASLTKSFNPTTIAAGGTTTLTFSLTNPGAFNTAQVVSFTDTLPSGLSVAAAPNIGGTCSGGSVSAVAGSNTVTITSKTVPASSTLAAICTVTVDVTNVSDQLNPSCANNPVAFTNAGLVNTTGVNNISGLSNLTNAVTQSCVVVIGQNAPPNIPTIRLQALLALMLLMAVTGASYILRARRQIEGKRR